MSEKAVLKKIQKEWHGTLKSYITGFILSLGLTCLSFYITWQRSFSKRVMIYTLITLSLVQAAIQLIFFLHLGQEKKPHYFLFSFCFTVIILLAIVIGSIWIMNDLNFRMMPHMESLFHD